MLIHPGFPVRMVQWGGKRNSSTATIKQNAQPNTAQVNLLGPAIFDSFPTPKERDLCLGRIKFLYT